MTNAKTDLVGSKRWASTIRRAIESVISDAPNYLAVKRVVTACHRFALAYVLKKATKDGLQLHLFGLSAEDLALDAIAELFQRDDRGRFPVLRAYFANVRTADVSIDELNVALRRLVFSKVSENLFRRYHEADPNLSKIIRLVKDAAKKHPGVRVVRCRNQQWLLLSAGSNSAEQALSAEPTAEQADAEARTASHLSALPIVPSEILEAHLTSAVAKGHRVHDLMIALIDFLQMHPYYAAAYPLSGFAQAVRSAFLRVGGTDRTEEVEELLAFEVIETIQSVTTRIASEKWSTYVHRGKVTPSAYSAYFEAIRSVLKAQYVDDAEIDSLYSALSCQLPGLSEDAYRQEHRNKMEYLIKLARTQLLNRLSQQAYT